MMGLLFLLVFLHKKELHEDSQSTLRVTQRN